MVLCCFWTYFGFCLIRLNLVDICCFEGVVLVVVCFGVVLSLTYLFGCDCGSAFVVLIGVVLAGWVSLWVWDAYCVCC